MVGLSSAALFDRKDPTNPINRRISIIVMTKKAEQSALATDDPRHTISPVKVEPDTSLAAAGEVARSAGEGSPAN